MTDLGTLGGSESRATDVNADGSVVVGGADNGAGDRHAFRWTSASNTMTDLGTLGGSMSQAFGVSGDGSIVVGWSNNAGGETRPFIWSVNEIQDLENLQSSVGRLAADRGRVLGQGLDSATDVATLRCDRFSADRRFCARASLGGGYHGFSDDSRSGYGGVSLGMAVTDRLDVGLNYAVSRIDTGLNGVKAKTGSDLSVWAMWKADRGTGTGLVGGLFLGGGWRSDTYIRGGDFEYVQRARAKADLHRGFVRGSIGYGLTAGGTGA